jgi:uncharacterized protein (DUF433 family)
VNLPGFLTRWPSGEIVVTGHRIGLFSIIDRYQQGLSAEQIHAEFPTLELDTIRSVLAFHADHRADVEKYVSEYRGDLERQEAAFKPTSALLELRRPVLHRTAEV